MQTSSQPIRPFSLIGIAITMVFAGAFVGVVTNWINSIISTEYFQTVMGWENTSDPQPFIIAQGILEGIGFGFLFSFVFTLVVGIVSKARCSYVLALRYIAAIIVGVLVFWAIGGCVGTGLAGVSPGFFRNTFLNVPTEHGAMLRYAWVGGSIWGVYVGGVLVTVVVLALFGAKWTANVSCRAFPIRIEDSE